MSRSHITSGIQIFQSWVESRKSQTQAPGRDGKTIESHFMESEIGPILCSLRMIVLDRETAKNNQLFMNPVDENGDLMLGDRFDSIQQARVGLVDMLTNTNWRFDKLDKCLPLGPHYSTAASLIMNRLEKSLVTWQRNFDDLVRLNGSSWVKRQRNAANAVRLIRLDLGFGIRNYHADTECSWDAGRADYEEALSLIENLIADRDRFSPGNSFRPLSLDFAIIYCLHAMTWKCRWPRLRRWGLELFRRICGHEWLLDAEKYYNIFYRIMEIEEAGSKGLLDEGASDQILPPENRRVHHFSVAIQTPESSTAFSTKYAVTFWSKPDGIDGPWQKVTEPLQPGLSETEESTIPVNLINEFFAKPPRIRELDKLIQGKDLAIRERS